MSDLTSQLVAELVADLRPVRRIPRLRAMALGVLGPGLLILVALAALRGLRHAVVPLAGDAAWLAAIAGLLILAIGALAAAVASTTPGRERVIWGGLAAATFGVFVSLAAAGALFWAGSAAHETGPVAARGALSCLILAAVGALAPALILARFLSRGLLRRPWITLALGACALTALGACAAGLSCHATQPAHLMLAHVLAPAIVGPLVWIAMKAAWRPESPA